MRRVLLQSALFSLPTSAGAQDSPAAVTHSLPLVDIAIAPHWIWGVPMIVAPGLASVQGQDSTVVVRLGLHPDGASPGWAETQTWTSTSVPGVSFSKARNAKPRHEDHIRLVLDTFADGRTGYVFAVNPCGARYDALLSRQGEDEKSDRDGIWEAATAISATGWWVEIRIPIKTLTFRAGTPQ